MRLASRLVAPIVALVWALLYVGHGLRPGYVLLPLDLLSDLGAWKSSEAVRVPVSNHLLSDTVLQFWSWNDHARRTLGRGEIPWMNPHQGNGEPFVANPQTALLSPFAWPPLVVPDFGWALSVLLKLLIAGLGGRALARAMGASDRAAIVSGLVYSGSGALVLWALYPHASVAAFLPWLGAAMLRLVREPSPKRVSYVVLAAAAATAGGHPEWLFFGLVGLMAFVLWDTVSRHDARDRRVRRLALAAGSAALGFLLLSVVVVPFLVLLRDSPARATRISNPPEYFRVAAAVSQVFPGFLGMPLKDEIDLSLLAPHAENLNMRASAYIGALVLLAIGLSFRTLTPSFRRAVVIAAVALLAAWRMPPLEAILRRAPVFSMAAREYLAIVFVLLASAASGPALEALAKARPNRRLGGALVGIGLFLSVAGSAPSVPWLRQHLRSIVLDGIDHLRSRGTLLHTRAVYEARLDRYVANVAFTALRRAAVPGLALGLAGVALLSTRRRGLYTIAALSELLAVGIGYLPAVQRTSVPGPPPAIVDLMNADPARLWAYVCTDATFPSDLATHYGLRDISAYDALNVSPSATLLRKTGWDFSAGAFGAPLTEASVQQLADGGVRYFVGRSPVAGTTRVGGDPPPGVGLYERAGAMPATGSLNVPPTGFKTGLAISLAALLSLPLLLLGGRSRRLRPDQPQPDLLVTKSG